MRSGKAIHGGDARMSTKQAKDERLSRGSIGRLCAALVGCAALLGSTSASAVVDSVALAFDKADVSQPVESTVELHCLALNIYHEARSEAIDGKFAVGQVTMNRVRSRRYPDSICEVVWQRGQFSWTHDGRSDRPYNLEAWEEALWVARIILDFNPVDMVGRATHYHADYVHPSWATAHRQVARIGRHIFYEPPSR